MVDAQPEYKMDHILHKHGVGSQRYFFVGLRGWDDSEAQWISKVEVKNASILLVEWEK